MMKRKWALLFPLLGALLLCACSAQNGSLPNESQSMLSSSAPVLEHNKDTNVDLQTSALTNAAKEETSQSIDPLEQQSQEVLSENEPEPDASLNETESEEPIDPDPDFKKIGSYTTSETLQKIFLTNQSVDITELYLVSLQYETLSENLLQDPFLVGETRVFYYDLDPETYYHLLAVYQDGTQHLHYFPFFVTSEATIYTSNDTLFLKFFQNDLENDTFWNEYLWGNQGQEQDPNTGCISEDAPLN